MGRAPGRLGDPRGGRRPARLLPRRAVRPRGAADRRDRLRHRRGDRRPRRRTPGPQRAGPRGLAARRRRLAVAGRRGGGRQRPVLLASTPSGRWRTCSAPASLAELWTFFPDPWRKTRHHKRRLVNPANAALAPPGSCPGGAWRLATDWADYAEQMREVLDAEPTLEGGRVERWAERPVTRFERKGVEVGRDDRRPAATAGPTGLIEQPAPRRRRGRARRAASSSALRASCTSRASSRRRGGAATTPPSSGRPGSVPASPIRSRAARASSKP